MFAGNLLLLFVAIRFRALGRYWAGGPEHTPLAMDLTLIRCTAFLFGYITLYSNLKVRIPVLNPATHDATLRSFETAVLGFDITAWTRTVQEWPQVAHWLDLVYHHDYIFLTFSMSALRARRTLNFTVCQSRLKLLIAVSWP